MSANKIIVNTGNVLNLIEIKQKAGQNVTDELTECLQITFSDWEKNSKGSIGNGLNSDGERGPRDPVLVSRLHDDLHAKMAEEDRKNLKIGIKVFLSDDSITALTECLEYVYKTLAIEAIDNLVLAYNPSLGNSEGEDLTNGDAISSADSNGVTEDSKCDRVLPGLKTLWGTLEKYMQSGRILQLGVADLEEMCFKALYSWSTVKPTIVQINLSSCCVVPPGLQAFCKERDVQLLTHSDPQEIISAKTLGSILAGRSCSVGWCVRYQVHIRCRGVLAIKGYLASTEVMSH